MDGPAADRPFMPGYGVLPETEGSGLIAWAEGERRLTVSHDYWCATVRPDGAPHVLTQTVEGRRPPRLVAALADPGDVAEGAPRGVARAIGGQAFVHELRGLELEVLADLPLEVAIATVVLG